MELLCYRISIAWMGLVQSNCASAYRNTWMDGSIDPNQLIWSSQPLEDANRFRRGLLRVTGSFRMDASVAVVGLFLLANLIGLILGLWACFAKFQALFQFFQTDRVYQFNLLLASLGPPASCCGDPGLEAGRLSGFTASRSCTSISNFQGMQLSGDHTWIASSFGLTEFCFCSTSSRV